MARQFNTDCEGPITKNDNAMELSEFFIPEGHRFFALISKYDDYLADIERRPGYKAGDTLKLILPFLKAFGATDEGIRRLSQERLLLMPGAKATLRSISQTMETFIISTSYKPYVEALCEVLGFPFDHAYCTRLELDRYGLSEEERKRLQQMAEEIQALPMIEWPEGARAPSDLSPQHQETTRRLARIFWQEIQTMAVRTIFREVNPVGGPEKARAILDSLEKTGNDLADVFYVGDSITDLEAFELVKNGGGATLSFNGNRYALRSAEIACLSFHTSILAYLADIFRREGRKGLLETVDSWNRDPRRGERIDPQSFSGEPPKLCRLTDRNRGEVIRESEAFRKQVRGVKVGELG